MQRDDATSTTSSVPALLAEALRHHQAGRLESAEAIYRELLAREPEHADGLHLLGGLAHQTGRQELAVELVSRAIGRAPGLAPFHATLGDALRALGRPAEAAASYRRSLALRPEQPEVQLNLGRALREQGSLAEAVEAFRAALALRPDFLAAVEALGTTLQQAGRREEAVDCYRAAVARWPDLADAHHSLGLALREAGRAEEALASYRRALALRPDFPEALNNLGNLLREGPDQAGAEACYRRALALRPELAEAHSNLGLVLRDQGALAEAAACFHRAIALRPEFPDAHNNLAITLLAQGELAAGWPEYEWRWRTPQMARERRDLGRPRWRGEPGHGGTLLLHAEQGYGDTIQFCRFAPMAAARGWRVVLEVQQPLARLLRGLPGVAAVLGRGEALPAFDAQCPLLSLPLALDITLESIPAAPAYLRAETASVAAWGARLGGAGRRVGLTWAGTPKLSADARRSLPPGLLAPLLALPGMRFVSLQKEGPPAPAGFGLLDPMREVGDFADTAALVANLDLVISVDTAVAHLAAALGRPVWLLDRFDPCWRWLAGRADSPWYPTLRIFRQPRPGDWQAVVAEVAGELGRAPGALSLSN